jgi:DNA-binding NarL/FixJ family response regulator
VRQTAARGAVIRMGKGPLVRENRRVPTTVLVVDDHPGFRARARLLLESEGYEVVGEAGDGETALAEARRLRPELVLLDVQLPDVDGFDVAARITGGDGAPAVVLTSSRDWSDSAELIARSGARGFLPKDRLSGETIGELLR